MSSSFHILGDESVLSNPVAQLIRRAQDVFGPLESHWVKREIDGRFRVKEQGSWACERDPNVLPKVADVITLALAYTGLQRHTRPSSPAVARHGAGTGRVIPAGRVFEVELLPGLLSNV